MKLHIHGVHVPNRKNTAELAALRLPIPETVESRCPCTSARPPSRS